jgi:two-component system, OmpR family, alkaline phosphatase synthesis response regulator PhoP
MGQKILVVDDKPHMLRLIQHHLERAGYELIKARNEQEALEAMRTENPQLVVVDQNNQTAAGPQPVLDQLKQKKNTQPVPVVLVTDVPPALMGETPPETGAVLTKPFSPTELLNTVKRLTRCA